MIIRSKDIVDAEFLNLYPNLKIIVSATSGFDHFNLKELANLDVKTCYSPNANVRSATEITLFHMLNFLKQGQVLLSNKPTCRSSEILGSELSNKKVLIIGLGRIGSSVARTLQSLGCEVSAYDPYSTEKTVSNLDEALQSADIVSLHCPLTKLTKYLINKKTLSKMKPSSLLVNCARGGLVNTADLIKALNKGRIAGACLDVFEEEPLPQSSQLLKLPNVITTPHIGGYTVEAQQKSALEAAQQVKKWFEVDKPVLSLVPPDVAWKKDLEFN